MKLLDEYRIAKMFYLGALAAMPSAALPDLVFAAACAGLPGSCSRYTGLPPRGLLARARPLLAS